MIPYSPLMRKYKQGLLYIQNVSKPCSMFSGRKGVSVPWVDENNFFIFFSRVSNLGNVKIGYIVFIVE